MVNPKLMEAWFNLMVEAANGTKEAQEAFRALAKTSNSAEEMSRWLATYMPAIMASNIPAQSEAFEAWLEESWQMLGLVPRSRYLDLLEKVDNLQRKLDRAQTTIQTLQAHSESAAEPSADLQHMVSMWNAMLEDTLKAQTEWMQALNKVTTKAAPPAGHSDDCDDA